MSTDRLVHLAAGPLVRADGPPLAPSGDDGRSLLRRELLRPEYHETNLVQRVVDWFSRQFDRGLRAASDTSALSTLAWMLVLVALVSGLAFLVSRARRTTRAPGGEGAVLAEERVTADELRERARTALAEGRHEDAVVEGFRALVVAQVELGVLPDVPGATAHEVAALLGDDHPGRADAVLAAALLFDGVLYGDRPATSEQATRVLALDAELAGVR
ncbi:DUF4129 domain-containing protein [Nocardioides sp. SYSU D00038]|uniref:DUF4129 domain-containing protein n=1 Tax=Nocardioides sp. SYSU D00038 TaxID=2812554 RepID=UPI001968947E|nr:DUF4129 domain-containing protein [Nocardioides sp. SYSU D00038]